MIPVEAEYTVEIILAGRDEYRDDTTVAGQSGIEIILLIETDIDMKIGVLRQDIQTRLAVEAGYKNDTSSRGRIYRRYQQQRQDIKVILAVEAGYKNDTSSRDRDDTSSRDRIQRLYQQHRQNI